MTQSALYDPDDALDLAQQIDAALERVAQGDAAGLSELMTLDGARLWAICRGAVEDDATAEHALIKALNSIAGAAPLRPGVAHQRHWCGAITRHAVVNLTRTDPGVAMRLPHQPPIPEHALGYSEAGLEQAMETMDPARHEALRRVWTYGETYDSLARYFQIPTEDVRDWVRAAVVHLREAGWTQVPGGDDALGDPTLVFLAAEYALGILSPAEAAIIEEMMSLDPTLEQAVAGWCVGLAEMADTLPPIALDPVQSARIQSHVALPVPLPDNDPAGLWGLLWPATWGLGGAIIALLALYLWN